MHTTLRCCLAYKCRRGLKAHHPLEFYEVALKIYEKKGNKDKMNALKEEAEKYFGIKFLPFRWGQDNRQIAAVESENAIVNSIQSIKGYSQGVSKRLWEAFCALLNPSFIEVVMWLDKHGVKDSKVRPLVKIDYFQEFGNNAELLRILDLFEFFKQGEAKSIKKDKLDQRMEEFIARHGTDKGKNGNELKSYTITDMEGLLEELAEYVLGLGIPELTYKVKAENQKEILGYIDLTTYKESDRRKLYVLEKRDLKSKDSGKVWLHKLRCKSVGSGKISELDLQPWQMTAKPVQTGDIVLAKNVKKNAKGYWGLIDYDVLLS